MGVRKKRFGGPLSGTPGKCGRQVSDAAPEQAGVGRQRRRLILACCVPLPLPCLQEFTDFLSKPVVGKAY